MTFIQRFLIAWRSATIPTYTEAADLPGFWTEEDGLVLTHFFNSSTGQKLKRRLTNFVLQSAVEATAQPANHKYYCGKARGRAETVTAIEQHFAIVPAQVDESEESARTAEFLDSVGAMN